ncbi:MAG: hypothetical protein OJF49_003420 [Ktedonobacterales bacterium]|jgi:uncharacterized damage-inducible protein DinB|nr:MAG: hypothetical protein OJF49_003420 [Ktedonobacterales bacterium]
MATSAPSLASVYRGWETYQQHLITALTPLSSDQLALRAGPNLRSIGDIAVHIIGARARWIGMALGLGDDEIVSFQTWDRRDAPARTADELVTGMATTWRILVEALDHWTVADLDETFTDEEDGQQITYTRQWILWHLIEHDLHHGGELSFSLGMHGLAAPDL